MHFLVAGQCQDLLNKNDMALLSPVREKLIYVVKEFKYLEFRFSCQLSFSVHVREG